MIRLDPSDAEVGRAMLKGLCAAALLIAACLMLATFHPQAATSPVGSAPPDRGRAPSS
jgi:hypothetical protein